MALTKARLLKHDFPVLFSSQYPGRKRENAGFFLTNLRLGLEHTRQGHFWLNSTLSSHEVLWRQLSIDCLIEEPQVHCRRSRSQDAIRQRTSQPAIEEHHNFHSSQNYYRINSFRARNLHP